MAYFTKKTWKDRLVEFAGRRTLKNVGTNESVTYDVTRAEGTVSQEGDAFSPTNMNDMEQRIADGFAAVEEGLGGLTFGQDAEGNWGYKPSGADAVIPFNSIEAKTYSVTGNSGTTTTVNVALEGFVPAYAGMQSFNFDNSDNDAARNTIGSVSLSGNTLSVIQTALGGGGTWSCQVVVIYTKN